MLDYLAPLGVLLFFEMAPPYFVLAVFISILSIRTFAPGCRVVDALYTCESDAEI